MGKTRDQMVTIVADAIGKARAATALSGALLEDRCVDFLNWSQHRICRAYSFEELNVNTTAVTVADVKSYPLVTGSNNLGLVRPKDIQSIILDDVENSRKLTRWSDRKFDWHFPRPENYAGGRPTIYVVYANQIEMYRIPDVEYDLKIRYPQWPSDLDTSSQESDYDRKDQLIISGAILEGYLHFEEYNDAAIWLNRFIGLLSDTIRGIEKVDWEPQAAAFSQGKGGYESGEPWLDPYATSGDPLYGYSE